MSTDEAHAYEDSVAERLKKYLDDHPDVAEDIFGHPVKSIELLTDTDANPPSAGFHAHLSRGPFRLVRVDLDAYSDGGDEKTPGVPWSGTTGTEPRFKRDM